MFATNEMLKKRVYALTTDLFIIVVSNYFLIASFTNFLKTVFFSFPIHTQLFLIRKLGVMTSASLMSLTFAYFSLFYFITNGHTLGKTLFGLKVVNADGSELTLEQSMKRAIGYLVCAFFGSFLFAISFFRKDHKSLADLFSKSQVELESYQVIAKTEFELIINEEMSKPDYQEDKEAA